VSSCVLDASLRAVAVAVTSVLVSRQLGCAWFFSWRGRVSLQVSFFSSSGFMCVCERAHACVYVYQQVLQNGLPSSPLFLLASLASLCCDCEPLCCVAAHGAWHMAVCRMPYVLRLCKMVCVYIIIYFIHI
jgi:hypothetical protein